MTKKEEEEEIEAGDGNTYKKEKFEEKARTSLGNLIYFKN